MSQPGVCEFVTKFDLASTMLFVVLGIWKLNDLYKQFVPWLKNKLDEQDPYLQWQKKQQIKSNIVYPEDEEKPL